MTFSLDLESGVRTWESFLGVQTLSLDLAVGNLHCPYLKSLKYAFGICTLESALGVWTHSLNCSLDLLSEVWTWECVL